MNNPAKSQGMLAMNNPASLKKKILKVTLGLIIGLLILLWIYTGLLKLLNYEETKFQMGRSPFIQHIASFTAFVIPTLELFIAGLLLFKKTRFIGLLSSFFLMVVFTGYIYAMLNYSYYIPCSCGGVLSTLSWNDHLIFNIIFTGIAFIGIILQARDQGSQISN